jgi:hypothetical protein
MQTAYDWVTMLIFAALVTLFLARSSREAGAEDRILPYLAASALCAVANWLGNRGDDVLALAVIAAALGVGLHIVGRGARRRKD